MGKKQRTSIYLDEQDKRAIEALKSRYGITSDSDAIRFALRIVAREDLELHVRRETGQDRQK